MFPNWVGVIIVKRTVLESVLRYILVFLNCDDTMIAKHDALVCWFSFVSCVSQFGRCYKRKKGSTVNGLLCSAVANIWLCCSFDYCGLECVCDHYDEELCFFYWFKYIGLLLF